MNATNRANAKTWYARLWLWALVALLAIGIGSALAVTQTDNGTDAAEDHPAEEAGSVTKKKEKASTTAIPEPTTEPSIQGSKSVEVITPSDQTTAPTPTPKTPAPSTPAPSTPQPSPAPAPQPALTVSQDIAIGTAESYLSFTNFSPSGLIAQLEYEGYSNADAQFAVDSLNVDWLEQAVGSAESYLSFTPFSRSGLINQLEYEGFSTEQATYGVDAVSVDWYEQAALSAQSYLDLMGFSRQGLIDQLVYEGFSLDQATYGVDRVGL